MKKINVSIIINVAFNLFLFSTFIIQYEYVFVTRIASIIFAIVYLAIEIKKECFSENKMTFIIFSVASIFAIIISIFLIMHWITAGQMVNPFLSQYMFLFLL